MNDLEMSISGRVNVFPQSKVDISFAALLTGKETRAYTAASMSRKVAIEEEATDKLTITMNVLESKMSEVFAHLFTRYFLNFTTILIAVVILAVQLDHAS